MNTGTIKEAGNKIDQQQLCEFVAATLSHIALRLAAS